MKVNTRVLTAGTTFFLAAATGHFMQSGVHADPKAVNPGLSRPVMAASITLSPDTPIIQLSADFADAEAGTLPDLPPQDVPGLGDTRRLEVRMRKVERGYTRPASASDRIYSPFGMECAPSALTVAAAPHAMIEVVLSAPCHPNEIVSLVHAGLAISERTDAKGAAHALIPAFDPSGLVELQTASGEALAAGTPIDGLSGLFRAGIAWQSDAPLELNAYQNGASYGSKGHISRINMGNPNRPKAGYLLTTGDPLALGAMADIYSASGGTADIRLEITAEATPATCGRVLAGRLVELVGGKLQVHDLSFTMPDCDGAGGFAVMDIVPAAEVAVASSSAP